ncbi:MAG: PD-(D/E)XK nuclease family protein [Anaerolineales bacterium]|nr:PD-(D/E)XK nuclease family protein [Anaerolineales bacterium]
MTLPSPFTFSQSSLQDYNDCPRRFQLRYMERLAWPAVETEPTQDYENHQKEGSLFHRMVQQNIIGIPAEKLSALAQSDNLRKWWDAYQQHAPALDGYALHPEYILTAPIGEHRLVAKYDLIAIKSGETVNIYDWKTYRKRPRDEYLAARWQTRLYSALLGQAGSHLNGDQPIIPERIEMVYWFANFPQEPAKFVYNETKSQRDWDLIEKIVNEIASATEFPISEAEHPCRFCVYRSYCDRGAQAGAWNELDGEAEAEESFEIDFEQIGEVAF